MRGRSRPTGGCRPVESRGRWSVVMQVGGECEDRNAVGVPHRNSSLSHRRASAALSQRPTTPGMVQAPFLKQPPLKLPRDPGTALSPPRTAAGAGSKPLTARHTSAGP